jgi:hypothetical protein
MPHGEVLCAHASVAPSNFPPNATCSCACPRSCRVLCPRSSACLACSMSCEKGSSAAPAPSPDPVATGSLMGAAGSSLIDDFFVAFLGANCKYCTYAYLSHTIVNLTSSPDRDNSRTLQKNCLPGRGDALCMISWTSYRCEVWQAYRRVQLSLGRLQCSMAGPLFLSCRVCFVELVFNKQDLPWNLVACGAGHRCSDRWVSKSLTLAARIAAGTLILSWAGSRPCPQGVELQLRKVPCACHGMRRRQHEARQPVSRATAYLPCLLQFSCIE